MVGSLNGLTFDEVLKVMQLLKKSGWLTVKLNNELQYIAAFKDGVLVGLSTEAGEELTDLAQVKEMIYNFSYDWQGEYRFEPIAAEQIKVSFTYELGDLIAHLEEIKKEWAEIKKVVPSDLALVKLNTSIKKDTLISPSAWSILTAIFSLGTEATPNKIQTKLNLSILDVCRQIFSLAKDGLIEVGEPVREKSPALGGEKVKSGRYFKKPLATDVIIPAEWVSYYERLEKNQLKIKAQ